MNYDEEIIRYYGKDKEASDDEEPDFDILNTHTDED